MLGMAYPPCQLTDAKDLGAMESSGVGHRAARAKRFPVGRVPGTTALMAASTSCRAPQGCDVRLRAAL